MKPQLSMVLALALLMTSALSGPSQEEAGAPLLIRAPPASADCYWRPHPHSHEKSSPLFTSSELRHGWWLITALPHCGVRPLAGFVLRWNRLLENALWDVRRGYDTIESRRY